MTHRGPFQPPLSCDSVTRRPVLFRALTAQGYAVPGTRNSVT